MERVFIKTCHLSTRNEEENYLRSQVLIIARALHPMLYGRDLERPYGTKHAPISRGQSATVHLRIDQPVDVPA